MSASDAQPDGPATTRTEPSSGTPVAERYFGEEGSAAPWASATRELATSATFWLATLHPTGRTHVVPALAVVVDEALHFATSPETQKAHNLARDPRLTVTTSGATLDVVVEGVARGIHGTLP